MYSVNGTRSSCGDRGVSWVCWCGWGTCAIVLFVGVRGLRAAQGSVQEVAFESYSEGLLLLSGLPRISGFTMRACSGAMLRSPMTWSVLLCASCAGGGGALSPGGSGTGRCVSCAGWAKVCGAVLALDDGGLRRRGSGEGRGRGAGARGVEASRACGLGHHQCGVGHPSRLPLFRMVSSKAGAGSASGAVGGEWRHTNERW